MDLLVDTHILLWWIGESPRLRLSWKEALADPENIVMVSAATIWEIVIKVGLGKLTLDLPRGMTLATLPRACGFDELPIKNVHAEAVSQLPPHHADPFDRILLAQAFVEKATIVTADEKFDAYDVPLLPR